MQRSEDVMGEQLVVTEEEQPFWDERYAEAFHEGSKSTTRPMTLVDAERAATQADNALIARRMRQGVPVDIIENDEEEPPVTITQVTYGRSIELGKFGGFGKHARPYKKAWFGWEAEVNPGFTEEEAMEKLHEMADEQEKEEMRLFEEQVEEAKEG